MILGQRAKEIIDRQRRRFFLLDLHPLQGRVENRELAARRADVDRIRRELGVVGGLNHFHHGFLAQEFREQTGMPRMLVGHDHEGHAGIRGHIFEQLFERLEPAGRGSDADDRKFGLLSGWLRRALRIRFIHRDRTVMGLRSSVRAFS